MKGILSVLACFTFCLPAVAQENTNRARALPIYPWSEESSTARIAKELLLRDVSIPAIYTKRPDTGELGVTSNFIGFFDLNASEVQQITKALADAGHEYRTIAAQRLEPIAEIETERTRYVRLEEGDQIFKFRLTPFPEEASAIRKKLEEAVVSAVGAQRAEFFVRNAEMLDSIMPSFVADRNSFRSRESTFIYAY